MKRRDLLKSAAAIGSAALVGSSFGRASAAAPAAKAGGGNDLWKKLPRWRGFNLLEKFNAGSNKPFAESDFEWIHEWGFDWVRLPMDYRCWTAKDDPAKYDEKVLKEIDQAVEFGRKHKVHVCLNLHRAPGYTVASPPETMNLWTDEEAQKQFGAQWGQFARRYKGIPSAEVSFNLVNEPNGKPTPAEYAKAMGVACEAIRKEDPARLISCDGLSWGTKPVFELLPLAVAQSTRGYSPMQITHYGANWVNSKGWPEPTWPLKLKDKMLDREWLRQDRIVPWKKLEEQGVGIHVGEWGSHNRTPHAAVLGWMSDSLALWKEAGWGWGLWNLRGSFGVLDSDRKDVTYEDFHGHKLDRKMLELLRQD